jgi:hypothetical protein
MDRMLDELHEILNYMDKQGFIKESSELHDVFVKLAAKKKKKTKKKNVPNDPALYSRCKAEIKKKFEVWPSAYGSMALTKLYKSRGGTYKTE